MFLEHQGSSIIVLINCVAMVMAMVFEDHLFSLIIPHCFSLPLSYSHYLFPAWTEIRAHLLSYPGIYAHFDLHFHATLPLLSVAQATYCHTQFSPSPIFVLVVILVAKQPL